MFYSIFGIVLAIVPLTLSLFSTLTAQEHAISHASEEQEKSLSLGFLQLLTEHLDANLSDLFLVDFSEFHSHPFWNREICSLEEGTLMEEHVQQSVNWTQNPKWGEGDPQKIHQYYAVHQESRLDRWLGYIACRLGVIVHGDINQEQLSLHLQRFDIQKLLTERPYLNPVLSLAAQQLIYDSLHSVDRVIDTHLHNLGYDEGNYLNPKATALGIAPWPDYFKFLVMRYAAGMSSPLGSTQEARKRIHLYAKHFPKLQGWILPIHKAILPDGTVDWNNTGNFLKNRSALVTAMTFESRDSQLLPAVSVHPFDPKWQEKLVKAHAKGIRLVKWMPPQSIPPDSDLLDDYYQTLKQLEMTLIAHAGPEHTIPTNENNKQWMDWGNPLRFRKPLQIGVNVILAHCGHRDKIPDLDHPDQPKVPGYQLFLRLAKEAHQKNQTGEWTGKLFSDLAAVTTHYGPDFIKELLQHANEEGIRLIYGSDYPFTNLIKPKNDAYVICAQAGLLDPEKVEPLKEIRSWNPLLANYVFTRHLELQLATGEKIKFPDCTFTGAFKDAELKLIDQEAWQAYQVDLLLNTNH
jgi:mannonate dehydratase